MDDTLTPEQLEEGRRRFANIGQPLGAVLFDYWLWKNFSALLTTAERAVAERDALLFAAGKLRLCVTCGKLVDAEKVKRGDDLPECRSLLDGAEVAPCTFDLTPQEAIEYWRSETATLRAEVERLRVALKPFADVADEYADQEADSFEVWKDAGPERLIRASFRLGLYRAARSVYRAALNGGKANG